MSSWYTKYPNDRGEYEITFESKDKETTKAVEKVCCAIMDGDVKSASDVATVVHGRWDDDHKCTICRKEALYEEKPDPYACGLLALFYVDSAYCPNCGAKMDGE